MFRYVGSSLYLMICITHNFADYRKLKFYFKRRPWKEIHFPSLTDVLFYFILNQPVFYDECRSPIG